MKGSNIYASRPLVKADLARLAEPRRQPAVAKIRESHHFLARLFAAGLKQSEVARRTGFSYARVNRIYSSPAFKQLIADYNGLATQQWLESLDDYYELAAGNMVRAELQIADRLAEAEEAGETLPVRELIAISRDAADRFGYGKHLTQTNVNVDFAARLERAIKRSGKIIDQPSAPSSSLTEVLAPGGSVDAASAAPIPFRRRA